MKLTILKNVRNPFWGNGFAYFYAICLLALTGCTADEIAGPSPSPSQSVVVSGSLKEYQLPGYLSVGINLGDISSTRDTWNPGDNGTTGSYEDGTEYALAHGAHHYLLLYKSSETNGKPVVLPLVIEKTDQVNDNPNNVTIAVKSVISSSEVNVSTVEEMKSYFASFDKAYFILNANLTNNNTLVNGVAPAKTKTLEILGDLTENDLLKNTRIKDYCIKVDENGDIDAGGTEYFTMTTSVFSNGSSIQYASTINSDITTCIYDSADAALADNANAYVTGYVERLASKITVEFVTTTGQNANTIGYASLTENGMPVYNLTVDGYDGLEIGEQGYTIKTTPVQATVTVMGYGLNCLERSSNLLKHISQTNYYDNWNEVGKHRSYWSEDPNYLINSSTYDKYPVQYRWALEIDTVRSEHTSGHTTRPARHENEENSFDRVYMDVTQRNNDQYVLDYFSFRDYDFTGTYNHDAYNQTASFSRPAALYSVENTTSKDEGFGGAENKVWNRGAYSATENLIVVGKLSIDGATGDLYRGQNNIFYTTREELLRAKLDIMERVILPDGNSGIRVLNVAWKNHNINTDRPDSEDDPQYITLVDWPNGSSFWILPKPVDGDFTDDYRQNPANYHKVEWSELWLIPAEIAGGDGQRLIAPKDEEAEYYFAKSDENGQIAFNTNGQKNNVKVSYDLVVSLFHKIIGPIERYEDGYVYYSMPIPHSQTTTDMENSWKTVGNLGVVRNNWYNIKITGINGVGTSVDDPEQPIIPVLQVNRSYLNGAVEIIDWHTTKQEGIPEPNL